MSRIGWRRCRRCGVFIPLGKMRAHRAGKFAPCKPRKDYHVCPKCGRRRVCRFCWSVEDRKKKSKVPQRIYFHEIRCLPTCTGRYRPVKRERERMADLNAYINVNEP